MLCNSVGFPIIISASTSLLVRNFLVIFLQCFPNFLFQIEAGHLRAVNKDLFTGQMRDIIIECDSKEKSSISDDLKPHLSAEGIIEVSDFPGVNVNCSFKYRTNCIFLSTNAGSLPSLIKWSKYAYFKNKTVENWGKYCKVCNDCVKATRKVKKDYFLKLNINSVNDNKTLWRTVKPFFTDKNKRMEKSFWLKIMKLLQTI